VELSNDRPCADDKFDAENGIVKVKVAAFEVCPLGDINKSITFPDNFALKIPVGADENPVNVGT
jgi:hypothetical protein